MLRNYISIALRNASRHRGYTLINLIGLAAGLAGCLLIALFVCYELSYDRMHEKSKRIVRVEMGSGDEARANILMPVGPELKERYAEVEAFTRVSELGLQAVQTDAVRDYESGFVFAEPAFFELFDFPLRTGSHELLAQPGTVLLSASTAHKYFGDTDPVGHRLTTGPRNSDEERVFEVAGVFEDMPGNVHFQADFLASFATLESERRGREWRMIATTYLLLRPDADWSELAGKLDRFVDDVVSANFPAPIEITLRPLERIHLYPASSGEIQPQGDIWYVWIASTIAILILLIACINYMNLATARSARRAREVGVRKTVGARREQLVAQFLSESLVMASGALVLALALVQLLLPHFGSMVDRSLSEQTITPAMYLGAVVLTLLVGLLSGSYPAVFLSKYRPSRVLKGSGQSSSFTIVRKGLVVIQFVISTVLILGTLTIHRQLDFVRETRLGFDPHQLLVLPVRGDLEGGAEAFKQAVQGHPAVSDVSFSSSVPGRRPGGITFHESDGIEDYEGETLIAFHNWVDLDFLSTIELNVIEGRGFDPDRPGDIGTAYLLNEAAVRELGWSDPVGKTFMSGDTMKEVIGVVEDYHTESMKSEIRPVILELHPEVPTSYLAARLSTDEAGDVIEAMAGVWSTFIPGRPFQYFFLDDEFDAMYRSEQRTARLFNSFSMLALLIATLGLFGLAAYTAQQRTKEIGIRKVLGASISGIVVMLSRDFVRLVLVAFVIAAPLAWFAMEDWLSAFAYRIELGPGIFVVAGLIALTTALVTVSWQAVRAALANPVDSLRTE